LCIHYTQIKGHAQAHTHTHSSPTPLSSLSMCLSCCSPFLLSLPPSGLSHIFACVLCESPTHVSIRNIPRGPRTHIYIDTHRQTTCKGARHIHTHTPVPLPGVYVSVCGGGLFFVPCQKSPL
jgi:hypothetical protein